MRVTVSLHLFRCHHDYIHSLPDSMKIAVDISDQSALIEFPLLYYQQVYIAMRANLSARSRPE